MGRGVGLFSHKEGIDVNENLQPTPSGPTRGAVKVVSEDGGKDFEGCGGAELS